LCELPAWANLFPVTDEDATLVIEALFDIRTELREIRRLLEEEYGGEQGREEEEP
jgi:hypothetical protein